MKLFPALLALLLSGIPCLAQKTSHELSPELAQQVDSVFAAYEGTEQAGMSVAVYRQGKLAYARGFGLASMEHGVPNTPQTVFRIGSTSKQFTAACVVILSLMEELSLEDDIRKHLPGMPDYGTPIRIRHLLHHTSGLRDYIQLAQMMGRSLDGMSIEECVQAVARQKGLAFQPGETFQYSNSNYLLLGEIVQRVTGEELADFAMDNIFIPLGMKSTHFHDRHGHVVKQRALGYSPNEEGELELDITKCDCVGDGGVFTTVEDLLRWDANFYDDQLTGGLPFTQAMLSPGLLNDGSELEYCAGLIRGSFGELPLIMHSGAWVGYLTEILRFPEQELSVVCLANRSDLNPTKLCTQVAARLLAKELGPEPALSVPRDHPPASGPRRPAPKPKGRLKSGALAEFAGTYHSEELQKDWNITLKGARLILAEGSEWQQPLGNNGLDCFRNPNFQVQFNRTDGVITGYTLWAVESGEFAFKRR